MLIVSLGDRVRRISGAHWQVSMAESASSRFSERACLRKHGVAGWFDGSEGKGTSCEYPWGPEFALWNPLKVERRETVLQRLSSDLHKCHTYPPQTDRHTHY